MMHINRTGAIFSLALLLSALATETSQATTMFDRPVPDPLGDGTCVGKAIGSYGGYIFQADSKYDGVYWPYTSPEWIWYCPESGYFAFGNHFEDLSQHEAERIREYLAGRSWPKSPIDDYWDSVKHLEKLYELRDLPDKERAHLYRVLAYLYERVGQNPQTADGYRARALPLVETLADSLPQSWEKMTHLFVAGEYHRRMGNLMKANSYFRRVQSCKWTDRENTERTGSPYFDELIYERRELMAGKLFQLLTRALLTVVSLVAGSVFLYLAYNRGRASTATR